MIKDKMGKRLDALVRAVFPFLFKRPINPDLLSVMGAGVSLTSAVAFAQGEFVLGGVLMLLGGVFDLVDGVVARHFGISTTFGGFLDSTLDRLVDMAVLLGIVMFYSRSEDLLLATLAAVSLISSVLTSYAKARAEVHIEELSIGVLERGERFLILAAGSIFGFMSIALWVLAIGATFTAGQRLWVAHREMARLDAGALLGGAAETTLGTAGTAGTIGTLGTGEGA